MSQIFDMMTLAKGAGGECVSYLPQFVVRDPVPPVYLFISRCSLFLACGCIYALVPTLHHFPKKKTFQITSNVSSSISVGEQSCLDAVKEPRSHTRCHESNSGLQLDSSISEDMFKLILFLVSRSNPFI